MTAQIINLGTYRRSRRFKAMKQRMERGEIRLPTSAELHQEWVWVASAIRRLVEAGLEKERRR